MNGAADLDGRGVQHMAKSLNDILSDEKKEETPEAVEASPEVEQPEVVEPTEEIEKGVDTPEQAEPVEEAVPPTELPKEEYVATKAERERRQKAERERDDFSERLAALQQQIDQQPKEPPPPAPDIWEDETAWQQHFEQQVMQQTDQLSRINASEMAARTQHTDFQEMYDLFNTMAGQNPAIVQQAMGDPHPWGKAYEIARNYKTMSDMGAVDVADLEAKMREKILAEAQQAAPVTPQAVPPTLSNEQNVGARSGPEWSGVKPLGELLK